MSTEQFTVKRARGGYFHLQFTTGSRRLGSCARAHHAYLTRTEECEEPKLDPVVYTESDHLPNWAENSARAYWDAADLYERPKAILYISADFALPRLLDLNDRIELARAFDGDLNSRADRLDTLDGVPLRVHRGLQRDECDHAGRGAQPRAPQTADSEAFQHTALQRPGTIVQVDLGHNRSDGVFVNR